MMWHLLIVRREKGFVVDSFKASHERIIAMKAPFIVLQFS
jgi:hypothetical protein